MDYEEKIIKIFDRLRRENSEARLSTKKMRQGLQDCGTENCRGEPPKDYDELKMCELSETD